jgi:UDP-glucose 4-epimerase
MTPMRVLVTGGAGYIGSHTVVQLAETGHEPVIVDNFSNANPAVLDRLATITGRQIPCHHVDVTDAAALEQVFAVEPVDAVIHFAGLKAVGESVEKPLAYYGVNLGGTITLTETMRRHGVDLMIFSSSATVYGPAGVPPLREDAPTAASNPYGWTKVMNEQILRDAARQHAPRRVGLLRYFNPVGAHPSGLIGEDPRGIPNNLSPFIAQVAAGRRPELLVFGADYPTPDGTCLRDYIHVEDLAGGHLAALDYLAALDHLAGPDAGVRTWNLGTGRPSSVLEVLAAFERAVGRPIRHRIVERRAGDVPASYADPSLAQAELGWVATRGLDEMCADTWRWQSRNPQGYGAA